MEKTKILVLAESSEEARALKDSLEADRKEIRKSAAFSFVGADEPYLFENDEPWSCHMVVMPTQLAKEMAAAWKELGGSKKTVYDAQESWGREGSEAWEHYLDRLL